MSDQVLALGVPEEVEGPTEGVADEVWGQAAVEGAQRGGTFAGEEGVEDPEGWERGKGKAGGKAGAKRGLGRAAWIGVDWAVTQLPGF